MRPELSTSRPLCVDLDGTLLRVDSLHEGAVALLLRQPWRLPQMIGWLLSGGRAGLKEGVARTAPFDVTRLPYDETVLAWLRSQRGKRRICLVTAAHAVWAQRVAAHLGLFDEVMASSGGRNLKGTAKAACLVERFGVGGFDYVGNDVVDMAVWRQCAVPVAANVDGKLAAQLQAQKPETLVLSTKAPVGRALWRALRPHQWSKNFVILVPLILAHRLDDLALWVDAGLAFVAFSLVASAVYLLNDLVDLEHDRGHPDKRRRPFAAGDLSLSIGVLALPALLLAGAGLALTVSGKLAAVLAAYFLLTTAYSLRLKRLLMADVVVLACLYGVRLVAGGYGLGVALSHWLLAFSVAFFSALALAKRITELRQLAAAGQQSSAGRGYRAADCEQLAGIAAAAGYTSLAILMLYINGDDVRLLYKTPALLWLLCPLLQYWTGRILLIANRGELQSDPVVYALRDRASYIVGATIGLVVWAAATF